MQYLKLALEIGRPFTKVENIDNFLTGNLLKQVIFCFSQFPMFDCYFRLCIRVYDKIFNLEQIGSSQTMGEPMYL